MLPLLHHIPSYFVPQLSPLLLNNSPFAPSLSPSINLSTSFLFPHPASHLPLLYFSLSLCPTGVRAGDDISILQVHTHHHGKSLPILPPSPSSLMSSIPPFSTCSSLLLCPFVSVQRWRKYEIKGEKKRWQRERKERADEGWGEGKRGKEIWEMNTLYKDVEMQRRMAKKLEKKGSEVKVMTDVMCPFSSATRHLLYASGVFHLPLWYTPLPSYHSN